MKNKVELKKLIYKVLFVSILILFISLIINIYEYNKYTKNFNTKINNIVNVLQNKYPNLKEEEIIDILNSKTDESIILKKYGITLNNKSIIKENDKLYHRYIILNISYLY